jgi:hypothetical protein
MLRAIAMVVEHGRAENILRQSGGLESEAMEGFQTANLFGKDAFSDPWHLLI